METKVRSAFALLWAAALGRAQAPAGQDLTSLGIEDLLKVEVVTASKFSQSLKSVPAAMYVLTGEEIVRSGAQSLPDMLRLVPGVHVAQINANVWMVSIRGFNLRYANKLQVLIDGHSIYTPLFSGVNWDEFHVSPDEIDRIEVIRGPGGAVWGANAVNGVINIITKKASETQGGYAQASVGDPLKQNHRVRFGGAGSGGTALRGSMDFQEFDDLAPQTPTPANDGWRALRGAFRLDGSGGTSESFMLSGYGSNMDLGQVSIFPSYAPPFSTLELNNWTNRHWYLNGSWTKSRGEGIVSEARASYSSIDRNDPDVQTRRGTLDFEYRTATDRPNGQRTSYGVSFRQTRDETTGRPFVFTPTEREDRTFGAFLNYERPIGKGKTLTFGSTVEHNDYTGVEFQPHIRMAWEKSPAETYWVSLSRAVRVPSRAESDASFPISVMDIGQPLPLAIQLVGNPDMKSEKLIAFETGVRWQPSSKAAFEGTVFLNWYDDLRTFEPIGQVINPDPIPHIENQFRFDNKAKAFTGGIEANAQLLPNPNWKLSLTGALFTDRVEFDSDSQDLFGDHGADRMGSSPRWSFGLRSSHDIGKRLTFDLFAQYVDKVSGNSAPAYTRLDARIGWNGANGLEASLTGQNLLKSRHKESGTNLFEGASFIERSIVGMLSWRFGN